MIRSLMTHSHLWSPRSSTIHQSK